MSHINIFPKLVPTIKYLSVKSIETGASSFYKLTVKIYKIYSYTKSNKTKLPFYRLFNYILKLMHTGCQWEEIPIEKDESGKPEIHHTRIFRTFQRWHKDGCFEKIFESSVQQLFDHKLLDTSVIHGDGSTTEAKKGGII